MNIHTTIHALAATPDSVVIAIGTGSDLMPWEFLRCGKSTWIAPCPCCSSGVIETDSPDYAAAKCDACFDAVPVELAGGPPAIKDHSHQPATASLPTVIPAPVLTIVQPKALFGHQTCRVCQRYMTVDNSSGQMNRVCGHCREESGVNRKTTNCEACGADITHLNCARRFCVDCNRERTRAASRVQKERRAERVKLCKACSAPLPPDCTKGTKYCPDTCAPMIAAEKQKACVARSKAKKKQSGMDDAGSTLQPAECAESGIPLTSLTTSEAPSPSNTLNVVNS